MNPLNSLSLLLSLPLILLSIPRLVFADSHQLGLSAPLSGPGAGWGTDIKNVLQFANEKLAGGKYSFVFEDDLCDPKTSLSVAQKLSSVNHIREVFIVCGQSVMSAAPLYKRLGVTLMAPLATPSRISELGVFRTGLNDAASTRMLAQYISARHKHVYVLTEENDYPVEFLSDFQKNAKELGLSVTNENYLPTQHDFRSQLVRYKSKGVDAIFLNTQTEEALASLVKQIKELNMSPKIYGAYLPGSANFLKNSGAIADGIVFVDFPGTPELLNKEGQELYTEYLARYGPLNGWTYAFPGTFEAFRAVHLAISSGKPVAEFLQQTTFEGVFGSYKFNAQGDILGPKHVLRVIRNGASELIS